jgi:hypothetical protein
MVATLAGRSRAHAAFYAFPQGALFREFGVVAIKESSSVCHEKSEAALAVKIFVNAQWNRFEGSHSSDQEA